MTTRYSDYSPYWQIRTRNYSYHPRRLVMAKLYCKVHVQLQAYSNSQAQRTSPWLQHAAVCIQSVTVVRTCCSLYPDSHRGYNVLQSAARQSPSLQLAAVCNPTVTVVTTCCSLYPYSNRGYNICGLYPDSNRGYNLLQSVSKQ